MRNPFRKACPAPAGPDRVEATIARARAEHLTYLKPVHLRDLADAVRDIEARGLPGLLVEAGTARGGSAIVMAVAKRPERPLKVYDVFGMIPPPTEQDGPDVHERYAAIAGGAARGVGGETYYGYREDLLGEVTESFARLGAPVGEHHVELIEGLFEDTIRLDEPVALAHLDGDWYESTMTCLERIAPLLVPGGRIVLDDYDKWSGCRAAVDEYFAGRPGFRMERRSRLHVVRDDDAPATPGDEAPRPKDVVARTRSLLAAGRPEAAEAFADTLRRDPGTEALGLLAGGIVAYRRGYGRLAHEQLALVSRRTWARFAAAEYVRSGLEIDPEATLAEVEALVAADPASVKAKAWYEILAAVYGHGALDLARAVFAIFDRHVEQDAPAWRHGPARRDWLRPWLTADASAPTAGGRDRSRPALAILDYGHPSPTKASANIGDHVQSVAALGHVVRHAGVRLHGPHDLVALLEDLRARTRPERRRDDVDADLEVLTVHRDASMYDTVPEGTWTLAFGWFMHSLFNVRHAFPMHRGLRPIFVSFHCNKRDLLTPEAIEYLRAHGPVGCRDWTTVHLLLSVGVPAFFSGCLTTTIDTLFAGPDAPDGAPAAAVDVAEGDVPPGATVFRHSREEIRHRPFAANVREAVALLDTYRGEHSRVVTSRLHCYLPVRSIGVPVEFHPSNRADIRFDGLIDIDDAAFDAIRTGLLDKLERVLGAILAGRSEEEVYALWREITAAAVAAAEAHRAEPVALPAAQMPAATATPAPRGGDADAIDCAVVLRPGDDPAPLADSLLAHASRPLRLWAVVLPGAALSDERWTALALDATETAARLALPELVPAAGRLVLLPVDATATADVAELAALDLGPHALAAPTTPSTAQISGFGVVHAAAARLGDDHRAAADLRRLAHARHRFDYDAFTTDVLVLDVERLRAAGLAAETLALAQAFGLDHTEALHAAVGADRAVLPERWAVVPTRTPERGPGLVHWADGVMGWRADPPPTRSSATADAGAGAPSRPAA
jgi:hypothetical protein